jgi:hypothetical protein
MSRREMLFMGHRDDLLQLQILNKTATPVPWLRTDFKFLPLSIRRDI